MHSRSLPARSGILCDSCRQLQSTTAVNQSMKLSFNKSHPNPTAIKFRNFTVSSNTNHLFYCFFLFFGTPTTKLGIDTEW